MLLLKLHQHLLSLLQRSELSPERQGPLTSYTKAITFPAVSTKVEQFLVPERIVWRFCRTHGLSRLIPRYTAFTMSMSPPPQRVWSTENIAVDRLTACELCETRFIDDDHKDDHLNSCPNLPTFHKIRSLESEPSGEHDRCAHLQ